MTAQLDIFAPPAERITIEPTPEVVLCGANAASVPTHTHVPTPIPRAMPDVEKWLGALLVAEGQIRWRSWTLPHPLPLDERPEDCVGGTADYHYNGKGVGLGRSGKPVGWPVLLRGLREQREHEPEIADARGLAHAFHALEQYERFYVRDGESVGFCDGDWRERVAIPHLAKLRAIVEELGGDPDAALHPERDRVTT